VSQTTRIFLVRHGATVLSAEDRFAGSTDVALSDGGREQPERLARRLAPEPIARLSKWWDAADGAHDADRVR
jgi:broad specificity phosphatase PhoE